MTINECGVCGHIEIDQTPDKCLVCRSVNSFKENGAAIKKPGQTPGGEADKKHLPSIKVEADSFYGGADAVTVKVLVGEMEHPMKAEHYIRWVDFYFNRKFINRVWLSPEINRPAAAVSIKARSGVITVCQNCNLHGAWMTELTF